MNKKEKDILVEKILSAIKEAGYSQREFARKFGIAENLISHWSTGIRTPSMRSIRKVATGTKKNLSWFVGDTIVTGNSNIVKKNTYSDSEKEIDLLRRENELLKREIEILKKEKQLKRRQ